MKFIRIIIFLLMFAGIEARAQNLIPNPGFELGYNVDHDLVAINGSVVTYSGTATNVFEGDSALQINIETIGTGGPQVIGIRNNITGLDTAKAYSVRVTVQGPVGQKFRIRVAGNTKQANNFTVSSAGFNTYEFLLDPLEPSDKGYHIVAFEFAFTSNTPATWWVDNLVIEQVNNGGGSLPSVYVSPDGSDSNTGTFSMPVRTVNKALQLLAGDTIFLMEGTYHQEMIFDHVSGIANKPLVLTAYPGHKVTIDGTVSIDSIYSGWSVYSGNIYKTNLSADIWQLFVNGRMMNLCRWPNVQGFIEDVQPVSPEPLSNSLWDQAGTWGHSATSSTNGIMVDDGGKNLAGTGLDMTGAIAVLNVGSFKTSAAIVKSHAAGQNYFTYDSAMTDPWLSWQKPDYAYYYLEGKLNLLDHPGEWYFDKITRDLYLITPDGSVPDSNDIRGKTQSYALRLNGCNYITINDLNFWGTTLEGIDCKYVTIENCTFSYPSYSKRILGDFSPVDITIFKGNCSNITILNNTFQYTEGEGLYLKGSNHLIENNLFRHIDFSCVNLYNIGGSIDFIGENNIFRNNTIYIAGASETVTPGKNNIVEGNEVWGIGHLQNDGSMIQYMTGPAVGNITRYNWLHDSKKSGMRFDGSLDIGNTGQPGVWEPWGNQTKGRVYGNVIWNTPSGLMIKGDYHIVVNNTVFNNEKVSIIMMNPKPSGANQHSICRNNIADMISGYRGGKTPDEYPLPGQHSNNWNGYYQDEKIEDLFQDIGNRDFRPKNAMLLIDAGSDKINTDIVVDHKPVNKGFDLGAYEYGESNYNIPGQRLMKCSAPVPANGSISGSDDVILAWRPAYIATSYRIYVGNTYSAVKNAGTDSPEYMGEQVGNVLHPGEITANDSIFWRVDALKGKSLIKGDVWFFIAGKNANPLNRKVTFLISGKDQDQIIPLAGAEIQISGKKIYTGSNGMAVTYLRDSMYVLLISKPGYADFLDSIPVLGNTVLRDTLTPVFYRVQVRVHNDLYDTVPIPEALVQLDTLLAFTDSSGEVVFTNIPYDTLNMMVSADGYDTFSDGVIINSDTIFFIGLISITGLTELKEDKIILYPNPAREFINIQFPEKGFNLEIIDGRGRVFYFQKLNTTKLEVDVSPWEKGVYYVRITNRNDKCMLRKLIIY